MMLTDDLIDPFLLYWFSVIIWRVNLEVVDLNLSASSLRTYCLVLDFNKF